MYPCCAQSKLNMNSHWVKFITATVLISYCGCFCVHCVPFPSSLCPCCVPMTPCWGQWAPVVFQWPSHYSIVPTLWGSRGPWLSLSCVWGPQFWSIWVQFEAHLSSHGSLLCLMCPCHIQEAPGWVQLALALSIETIVEFNCHPAQFNLPPAGFDVPLLCSIWVPSECCVGAAHA